MSGVTGLRSRKFSSVLWAGIGVFLTLSLVAYPKESYQAAVSGMKIFFDVVFPSLLPFFIMSELLLGLGVVHCLGVLLEPLMRPLFNVPGAGAFALSMGLAAGYPMDAVITAKFRKNGMCTRVEGERLLAFTNTADPLFMFGAVAVGMFGMPKLGMTLAIAHYLASFLVGFVFRFYGRSSERPNQTTRTVQRMSIFRRAGRALVQARMEDGRPIGKLFSDSVFESIRTLLMICCYIMFFSVVLEVMTVFGVVGAVAAPVASLFSSLGWDPNLVRPLISGIFEIDVGTSQVSQVAAPLIQQVAVASAIIGWSGLSVHGQVASVMAETDVRMTPYVLARVLHALFAGGLTVLLMKGAPPLAVGNAIPTFFTVSEKAAKLLPFSFLGKFWATQLLFVGGFLALLLVLSLISWLFQRLRVIWLRL